MLRVLRVLTGSNGTNGATGASGANGSNGAAGPTGPSGPSGANGATGASGTDGSNGATGPTGPSGANGSNGTVGATGPSGATGAPGFPIWVNVGSDGFRLAGSSGTSASRLRTGVYKVTFSQVPLSLVPFGEDPDSCGLGIDAAQYLGLGVIGIGEAVDPPDISHDFFSVYADDGIPNTLLIGERNTSGTLENGPFSIALTCG